ncbi:hemerythrin family protein [Lachnospiraceae bacterium JLR.KK009]|nr:hemerythrin-like metal-binding domain-containing protein [Lachnospiraceae bacterium A2]MCI8707013.1 hemerythrin family protein [Lachnospiraceae bacterium]
MYEMKPEYYTGIAAIDQEHTRLFELAQETHSLLTNDTLLDKADSLVHLISELINYTRTHFSHEEEYQRSIGYTGIEEHAAMHRKFEDKLSEFDFDSLGEDFNSQNETVEELLGFLTTWLITHILQADMLYVKEGKAGKTI